MRALLLGMIVSLTAAMPAAATPLEDRLRDQLRATVGQLNELKAGQAALEAAKAAAEKERDALKAKGSVSPAATRELAAAKSQNAALAARAGAAASELAKANAVATELATRLRTAQDELAQQRALAGSTATAAATTAAALQACTDRNGRLVQAGRDLVALHQKRYGRGKFPPLQLLRTKVETEAQAIGDKVAADAIFPDAAATLPK